MQPVRMTVVSRYIGEEGSKRPGDVVFVTPHRAEQLESAGAAVREDAALKKPVSPASGPAQPLPSLPAVQVLPPQTPAPSPTADGTSSASTTPTASAPVSTSSTPATENGGTATRRKRGRPPKARS